MTGAYQEIYISKEADICLPRTLTLLFWLLIKWINCLGAVQKKKLHSDDVFTSSEKPVPVEVYLIL